MSFSVCGVTVEEGADDPRLLPSHRRYDWKGCAGRTLSSRFRPGAKLGPDVHIGNFVEVKNVSLGAGAKANHLSYLGDGSVGSKANIGAGTIFCNYDGYDKQKTEIGEGAFMGSEYIACCPCQDRRRSVYWLRQRDHEGRQPRSTGAGTRFSGGAAGLGREFPHSDVAPESEKS